MTLSKRKMIIEKSIELFSSKGFEATSIQEITEYCGMSKGAFYLSFKSKEELITSIIKYLLTHFSIEIDHAVSLTHPSQGMLQHFYEAVLSYTKNHRAIAVFLLTEQQQLQQSHKEIFQCLREHDQQFTNKISSILEHEYGSAIHSFKEDLILCVKSLCKTYGEYVLLNDLQLDYSLLALSLTEKTNALAYYKHKHALPNSFLQLQYVHTNQTEEARTSMQHELSQYIELEKEPLLKESLSILKRELQAEQPSQAIIQGMIANLEACNMYQAFCYTVRRLIAQ